MKKLKTSAEFFLNEARSITKISKELADITAKMKDLAAEFYQFRSQGAYAERLEEIKSELRDLTPKKKALMAELDNSIAGKDRNIELDIKESNNEDELTESADKWTLYVDGEKIKTFNSKKAAVTAYNKVVNSDDSTWDKATIKVGSDLYESTTNEAKFNRLPRKLDVMWDLKNTISSMFFKHSRGDDYDQDEMKSIESNIKDIKKAVKAFSNADDVKGTEYEVLESALTEAKFNRLPRGLDAIQDLKNSVRHMSDRYDKGYDYSPVEMKSIESNIKDIKKAVKAFSNADDVKGTEYEVLESTINEGVTVFEKDLETMIKEIKQGYGWIDPEYAMHTWEAISNSVPFDLVKFEIYKQLISAKLLAIASEDNEEEAGKYIKSIKELGKIFPSLGIKESVVTESNDTIEEGTADFMARFKKTNIILKKGYDHLSDEELNKVYTEVGELVTDNNLKVKEVNVVFESEVSEARTIQTKRRYTESHPASSVGKTAKIRNKILEAIKDGRMTQSEFDRVVKEMSSDHKRWMKRNSNLFNVSEDGISLSGFGQKILKGITVNEIVVTESFESFSNSLNDTKE